MQVRLFLLEIVDPAPSRIVDLQVSVKVAGQEPDCCDDASDHSQPARVGGCAYAQKHGSNCPNDSPNGGADMTFFGVADLLEVVIQIIPPAELAGA